METAVQVEIQELIDQVLAQQLAVLSVVDALSRSGAIDRDALADQFLAIQLDTDTPRRLEVRRGLAELISGSALSSPPALRLAGANDDEDSDMPPQR